MNAHICADSNRSLFSGLVQDLKLDVVVVVETWFEVNTSNKLVGNALGDSFCWFGREQDGHNKYRGEGGIGILVRKGIGEVSMVKVYQEFQGMWVKFICGKDIFFICGVYIPPAEEVDFHHILRSIEADCIHFRKLERW